jgi:hypothetical protein
MGFRIVTLGLLSFALSYCSTDKTLDLKDEYHQAINDLLKDNFGDAKFLVQLEVKPLYRTMFGGLTENEAEKKYGRENLMYLDKAFLDYLVKEGKLDKGTADNLFEQVDSTKTLELNQNELPQRTIRETELKQIFDGGRGAYGKLESDFGTSCFVKLSYPVFNKDRSILIFSLDRTCGPLNGDGTIYFMKKIEGKWTLIDEQETWAS